VAQQGFIEYVHQISGSISKKRRGHWMFTKFGAICLSQPVSGTYLPLALSSRKTNERNSSREGLRACFRHPVLLTFAAPPAGHDLPAKNHDYKRDRKLTWSLTTQ